MSLVLAGNTSGSTTLQATDAVTATITLPSATDTLVGKITPSFTTTIGVGAATPAASGAGITFPATQSASTDANTLDDYEEGTWTPNQGAGLTVVGAFSSSGSYTKVGNLVTIFFRVNGATSVAITANTILCSNLPFSGGTGANHCGVFTNAANNITGSTQVVSANFYTNTTVSATTTMTGSVTYTI